MRRERRTYLPELGTDLVSALSSLNMNDLPHCWLVDILRWKMLLHELGWDYGFPERWRLQWSLRMSYFRQNNEVERTPHSARVRRCNFLNFENDAKMLMFVECNIGSTYVNFSTTTHTSHFYEISSYQLICWANILARRPPGQWRALAHERYKGVRPSGETQLWKIKKKRKNLKCFKLFDVWTSHTKIVMMRIFYHM